MREFKAVGKLVYMSPTGISVKENKHYRWVCFDEHLIQSMISLKHPENLILPYINPFISFAKNMPGPSLLLGLGGGACVPPLLQAPLQVVEASEDMIAIAKTYFKLPQHPQLHITCCKAEDYMQQNQSRYQHILIDLGDEYGFPKACLELEFFRKCLDALLENGSICINLANFEDAKSVNDMLKSHFQLKTLCIRIHGNYLIHYSNTFAKSAVIEHYKTHFTMIAHTWDEEYGEVLTIKESLNLLKTSSFIRRIIIRIRGLKLTKKRQPWQ